MAHRAIRYRSRLAKGLVVTSTDIQATARVRSVDLRRRGRLVLGTRRNGFTQTRERHGALFA